MFWTKSCFLQKQYLIFLFYISCLQNKNLKERKDIKKKDYFVINLVYHLFVAISDIQLLTRNLPSKMFQNPGGLNHEQRHTKDGRRDKG